MPSEVSMSGAGHGREPMVEELKRELAEAREQQAATAEILEAISSSPTDSRGIFERIAESATRLCDAYDAAIHQLDGDFIPVVAHHGPINIYPRYPLTRGVVAARAVLDRRTIHVADLQAETDEYPEGSVAARRIGFRAIVAVPLIRAGAAIGVITLRRIDAKLFSERQIALLKTFADQAVIAIENARLFEEVEARTRELTEALEYQTATGEVLGVISRSPSRIDHVFETIIAIAERLCQADFGFAYRRGNDSRFHFVAAPKAPEQYILYRKQNPVTPGDNSIMGWALSERRTISVADVKSSSITPETEAHRLGRIRSALAVPLMHRGEPVGVIGAVRSVSDPFTDRQIQLVKTFADQAVIAIENTRLFEAEQASKRELQDSLQQQTATADVLKVISRSAFDLQTVLDTLVEAVARLCEADMAQILRPREASYYVAAKYGFSPEYIEYHKTVTFAPGRGSLTGRVLLEGKPVQIADVLADPDYNNPEPQRLGGYRTHLGVPLLRGGTQIGVILVSRRTVRPFDDKQIELVTTFADQAVIAIENTRLFEAEQSSKRDLQESLEYQTAISDVLGVISRSRSELQRVLDVIVETAGQLCHTDNAQCFMFKDGKYHLAASSKNSSANFVEHLLKNPRAPGQRGSATSRAATEKRTVHIPNIFADPEYTSVPLAVGRSRSVLAVPLMHGSIAVGVITMGRSAGPFTEKEIRLVTTFAAQAVIAIENTRLFEEVQARTRELAKTVEDLASASHHKSQFVANMSHELRTPLAAILGYAELMQEGFYETLGQKSLEALTRIRSNGKHLLGLINTVLDIAKIESGQFTLNMAEYAIESVVETVRSATESLAQNKKLLLTTEVTKPLPLGLGDEQRLTQVLLNLVGNAIKFTDTGEVRVIAKSVNGHFAVTVADTGPGIPAEHQTRIFDQFHQVDSSNTKAKGGTGLGLAIAKQIVEMHGGRIWVESTVGKGSTFQIEIPARAEVARSGLPTL